MRIKIGSRKSDLARYQAYAVAETIKANHPNIEIEFVFTASLGDKNLNDPLWKMPEKGVFTEDLKKELVAGQLDIVVHSWKDLPLPDDNEPTKIAMTLPRADQRDVVLFSTSRISEVLSSQKLRVLTSSPRREQNLKTLLPNLFPGELQEIEFLPVRGNVPTRVRQLIEGKGDALVVAKAALDRLLTSEREDLQEAKSFLQDCMQQVQFMVMPLSENPTAAAQGALAVEVSKENSQLVEMLEAMDHKPTRKAVNWERDQLKAKGGGCHAPMGFSARTTRHGLVCFKKGLDQDQASFHFAKLNMDQLAWPNFESHEVFPLQPADSNFFKRVPVEGVALETGDFFVSRWTALESVTPSAQRFLWTAGVKTWTRLAKMGHWVSGCSDQMGEEDPSVSALLGRKLALKRLSHLDAVEGSFPLLATYKLESLEQGPDLKNKKCFYWMSSTSFDAAVKLCPEILSGYHASGMGKTYDYLLDKVGDSSRVQAFYNFEQFKSEVLK